MKRKAKKSTLFRKERVLTEAELKKVAAGFCTTTDWYPGIDARSNRQAGGQYGQTIKY
jgi:hypothetical protein